MTSRGLKERPEPAPRGGSFLCYHRPVPTLYLVDGMSHVYRAYHAIRGLTNRQGLPTNAVYGFTTMLRKLIRDETPDYLGVAVDLSGPTVRHELFEDYKATRAPMPEDLSPQIPLVLEVCKAFRVPVLCFEKYEADDVIGTLAQKAAEQGLEVVIVTIDKDMFQLVSERIHVLDTRTMTRVDAAGVEKKLGVRPDQVVDVLSLVGDSSDNIPGAPGIGMKGAQQLIREYGTLDNLLAQRDQVARKSYRESLQQHEEQIRTSRQLLTIARDLPIELDLEGLKLSSPDREAVRRLFTELEFTSLLEEFLPSRETEAVQYRSLKEPREIRSLAERVAGKTASVALLFSAGGYLEGELEGVAVCVQPQQAVTVSQTLLQKAGAELQQLWQAPAQWVIHDLKPLQVLAQRQGWRLPEPAFDTMLAAYLLNPNKNDFSLPQLSLEYLQYRLQEPVRKDLFDEDLTGALGERADVTLRLYQRLAPRLVEHRLDALLQEIEIPLVEVLAAMERHGVRVDGALLEEMSREMEAEIESLTRQIYDLAGTEFNINSPKQLSEILFERLHLPTSRKTGKAGHYSTGVEVLEELAGSFDIARLILEYRELTKLKNTYLDALPKLVNPRTGRIHTSYNQMVAATGRLSSSNPNLQNIPIKSETGRKIRRAFIPEPGFQILAADYSQIELRILAHLSEDELLLEAFNQGEDIHERTAREVFGAQSGIDPHELRRRAKVINFGIVYGVSAFGLAQSLKIDRREAQRFIDEYFEKYRGVQRWIEHTLEEVEKKGYVVTLFHRIRPIPEIRSRNWNLREFGKRTAVNAPIQGTAADIIKKAMVSLYREMQERRLQSKLIMQVHDELVVEVENSEVELVAELVREKMEGVVALKVPLKVDLAVGPSWLEAK